LKQKFTEVEFSIDQSRYCKTELRRYSGPAENRVRRSVLNTL